VLVADLSSRGASLEAADEGESGTLAVERCPYRVEVRRGGSGSDPGSSATGPNPRD